LCTAQEVVVKVTAYQSGCSRQNHPEGCDNVYYKGCGGLTVSPGSNRIVVARTGGRSLGVLSYKSIGTTCQGRVVDAIRTYRGKKFNSPSYAEYSQKGHLYFSDSPFGLATKASDLEGDILDKSPLREIPFNGVYLLRNGENGPEPVTLVDCFMDRPNKIAFSPKQDIMYVTNSRKGNSYVKQFALKDDGTVANSSVFFNFTAFPELKTEEGYADGIKTDVEGNIYVAVHKGVYVLSPQGVLIGVLQSTQQLSALAFGGGRMFVTGAFGIVAQSSGVLPAVAPARAKTTCD
jgi:gluconolactonase